MRAWLNSPAVPATVSGELSHHDATGPKTFGSGRRCDKHLNRKARRPAVTISDPKRQREDWQRRLLLTSNDDKTAIAAVPIQNPRRATILICSTCRAEDGSDTSPRPGDLLAEAVANANDSSDIEVRRVECLANCKRRLSAALMLEGAWTYVFGDLSLDNAGDLIAGAKLFQTTENGVLPWRGRPQCLKSGLIARMPSNLSETAPVTLKEPQHD